MAQDDDQEKSQQPTPKRKREAKKKGQVPRSKELNTTLLLLSSSTMLILTGKFIAISFSEVMKVSLSIDRKVIFNNLTDFNQLSEAVINVALTILPFFCVLFLVSIASPLLLGGWLFNFELLTPKVERLNPLKGIKKMFSLRSLVDLGKTLLKFILILFFGVLLIWKSFPDIMHTGSESIKYAIPHGLSLLSHDFLYLSASLIIIAMFDVPYQIWEHMRKLKMSYKEIKDEMKESELGPEVKGKIRQIQQKVAQSRMMAEIPTADVVITNPTHFAVALRYDSDKSSAPKVVAKGADLIAEKIRLVARENKVEIVSAPPLARSLYHNCELFKEIPQGLYQAVAQILAYIYQLKRYKVGIAEKPEALGEIPIPDELFVE